METIIGITSILILKLTAMIAGYKIVALGHDTLLKGLRGEFEFVGSVGDKKSISLKGASPGLLFVLLGSLLIAWSIFVDKPITYKYTATSPVEQKSKASRIFRPQILRSEYANL